jgi:hypothetical protein
MSGYSPFIRSFFMRLSEPLRKLPKLGGSSGFALTVEPEDRHRNGSFGIIASSYGHQGMQLPEGLTGKGYANARNHRRRCKDTAIRQPNAKRQGCRNELRSTFNSPAVCSYFVHAKKAVLINRVESDSRASLTIFKVVMPMGERCLE